MSLKLSEMTNIKSWSLAPAQAAAPDANSLEWIAEVNSFPGSTPRHQAHTVVRVVASRELPIGAYLEITPQEPIRAPTPQPTEPPPEPMERLASTIDLAIDGHMTWDVLVGYVEEDIDKMKEDRKRIHRMYRLADERAQKKSQRADNAADAAGVSQHQLNARTAEYQTTLVELHDEIRSLRADIKRLKSR